MIKKISVITLALVLTRNSYAAGGADLIGVKGTLKNVEKSIREVIEKAEALYRQNGGAAMSSDVSLLDSGTPNPFLDRLTITTNINGGEAVYLAYETHLIFKGYIADNAYYESAETSGTDTKIPVTQALKDIRINFVPVYQQGDAEISSWNCITNADAQAKVFIGSNIETTEGSMSYISQNGNAGDNEYLSNCTYLPTVNIGF